jgi:hypothetical protein
MNRYQLEVAKMDWRHRRVVRAMSFTGVAIVTALALWASGLPPSAWIARLQQWLHKEPVSVQLVDTTTVRLDRLDAPALQSTADPHAVVAGTDSSVSQVPLPLYLIATFPGRNAREGTAQIGTQTDNPQTYGASAILANGAQLVEIHSDHVLLTKDGQSARLYLKEKQRVASELLLVGGESSAKPLPAVTREVLTDYLRPSPVYDGETLTGYRVYAGTRSGPFFQWGLQGGDVITAINGQPLNEPTSAIAALRQLVDGIAVTATIDRNGTRQQLSLDGASISADQNRLRVDEGVARFDVPLPPR